MSTRLLTRMNLLKFNIISNKFIELPKNGSSKISDGFYRLLFFKDHIFPKDNNMAVLQHAQNDVQSQKYQLMPETLDNYFRKFEEKFNVKFEAQNEKIDAQTQEIKGFNTKIDAQAKKIDAQTREIKGLNKQIDAQAQQINNQIVEIKGLNKKNEDQDGEIKQLRKNNDVLTKKVGLLTNNQNVLLIRQLLSSFKSKCTYLSKINFQRANIQYACIQLKDLDRHIRKQDKKTELENLQNILFSNSLKINLYKLSGQVQTLSTVFSGNAHIKTIITSDGTEKLASRDDLIEIISTTHSLRTHKDFLLNILNATLRMMKELKMADDMLLEDF